MAIGSWGVNTVRGVVDGVAGEWKGTVIHVDVVAFYPDGGSGEEYWPVYEAIKAIPGSGAVKVAGVWGEDMEIGQMGDDEEMAELLGVAVEELAGEESDDDLDELHDDDDDLDDDDFDDLDEDDFDNEDN